MDHHLCITSYWVLKTSLTFRVRYYSKIVFMGEILSLGDLFIFKLTKMDRPFFFVVVCLLIYKFCDVAPLEVIHKSNSPKLAPCHRGK